MPTSPSIQKLRADARLIFEAGVEAVDARKAVARHLVFDAKSGTLQIGSRRLSISSFERIIVIGAGKAAAAMAVGIEDVFGSHAKLRGIVNVKYGHTEPRPHSIYLNECGHPLPDIRGVYGARGMESILKDLTARDLLLVLISGGASALLPAPAEGISLEEKQQTTELLLRSGATIEEMNCVRKHISFLKGGQMAQRAGDATVITLILSDVVGDRLDSIGSGPTVPDSSTYGDAIRVLTRYDLLHDVPASVRSGLERGVAGEIPETPKAVDISSDRQHIAIIGSNRLALEGAEAKARSLGYQASILSDTVQGEARDVARMHVESLRQAVSTGLPIAPTACILSGGETTVTVRGQGKGGRNQEFALAAAIEMEGLQNAVVLAAGTDGTDGPTDAAGAIVDGTPASRARAMGIDPKKSLEENDAYPLLESTGDLLKTGPTGTNVMDLNVMLLGRMEQDLI
jgi:glycerate 2-kinase